MKFETGFEKKERDDRKAKGEKLEGLDEYKDFNNEPVDELLKKRRAEQEAISERQQERIAKLKELEETGKTFIKE